METWIALLQQKATASGRPPVFGHGDNPINFVSVVDVAEVVEQVSVDSGTRGKVLEICGPDNLTLRQPAVARSALGRPHHRATANASNVAARDTCCARPIQT